MHRISTLHRLCNHFTYSFFPFLDATPTINDFEHSTSRYTGTYHKKVPTELFCGDFVKVAAIFFFFFRCLVHLIISSSRYTLWFSRKKRHFRYPAKKWINDDHDMLFFCCWVSDSSNVGYFNGWLYPQLDRLRPWMLSFFSFENGNMNNSIKIMAFESVL